MIKEFNFWLIISFCISTAHSQYGVPQYLKTKYGTNFEGLPAPPSGVKTFTKTKTKTSGSSHKSPVSSLGSFRGGCNSQPPTPMNAGIRCSQYSGCRADCIPNYQFPNGQTQLFITCQNGEWQIEGTEWSTVPSCQPICLPSCVNNGICVAPNQCQCPENFSGPQCQFENKPCLNYPPLPMNSRRTCRSKSCTISCLPGHQFSDGSAITQMICKNGFWVPGNLKWTSVPDCQATCSPPCLNGGNCLSFNVCQCPQEYRGPQCQYSADVCSPKKLPFNGGYNCSGDADSFSCSLNCPEGINFEFKPEFAYTCQYSQGRFLPTPIPQCVFPENAQIIQGPGSSKSFYHIFNNTKYDVNSISINGLPMITQSPDDHFNNLYPQTLLPFSPENVQTNIGFDQIGNIHNIIENAVFVEEKLPEPGVCFTWGGTHYKSFDGKVFSFDSKCAYTLVRDAIDNTFSIVLQNSKECYTNPEKCYKIIKIYYQNKEYILKRSEEGFPIFVNGKKILAIPGQLPGVRVEMNAHYIVLSLDTIGSKIKWDGHQLVQVEVKENLWNRTEGLCGKIDGNPQNDFLTKDNHKPKSITNLALSWKVEDLEEDCNDIPSEEHVCRDNGVKGSRSHKATQFCKKLLGDDRFAPCHNTMDVSVLFDSCRWEYCSCKKPDPSQCACETMNVYVRTCAFKGVKNLAQWRDEDTCPVQCTGGRIYRSCGPAKGQAVCGASSEQPEEVGECVEGCYCPDGTVLHENRCITKDKCPCRLRGKSFSPGSQVPKDCNTCTCSDGQWVCTQVSCGARCAAVGDPHYVTFDGKKYDFMGQCSYYLVKTPKFSIEAENVACAGSISQAMNLPMSVSSGLPSCTKAVTIRISGQTIKLKQNHDLVVNGQDITKVPYHVANATIRSVSSIFLQVELPNGIQVWWDGVTRVYIDIPAKFQEQTRGLCGTFNNNQKDDFLTPEEDIEQSTIPFANKWKTSERCNDVPDKLKNHPCSINIHNKPTAEKHCQAIKSKLFEKCHWFVDPEPYYQDCLYDMCSCEFKVSKCLCPTVAAYAEECSRKGVKIDWRDDVRECGIHCPGGQKYQICGNTCTRSCYDISTRPECKPQCVEGCNCPEGQALDDEGECIPIGQCKCQHDGLQFNPGYKEVRPASKGPELCTCINAVWNCRLASSEEIKNHPQASDLKSLCDASEHKVFTTCEPVEPVTCKNMHSQDYFTASVCHAGCKCKDGYVLDTSTKKCVKPTECPCHHGGRSYKENSVVQNDCNTCQCQNGKWKCTDRPCSAECSAWGDSHFKTFDGKHYDYQGQCDYALAKGSLGSDSFDISIQNVPCGSLGTSCSKSVSIRLRSGEDQEIITLSKDKPLLDYKSLKHATVRQKGLFVIIEAPDLGLTLQWDQGTRVYVKVDPRWKDKVKGLCGNYNNNDADDFQTPSGGMTEVSAKIFGDSWKLQSYCPEALEITNTCEDRPDRKVWALKQCGVLKSPLFAACHSEVPIDDYLDKCVFDACACDQGGDCECLCTALAAYAQECNNRGVPIKWRSQKLCPMQCDERCSNYSPCISTCPSETCDNLLVHSKISKTCKEETCVEGCEPKPCPPDHVYLNSSLSECVPRNICKPFCLEIDGVKYFEGDLIEEDDCHSCYCSREQKICKGQPCSTTMYPTTHQDTSRVKCQAGWTKWINQDKAKATKTKTKTSRGKKSDIEPVPTSLILNKLEGPKCDEDKMIDIECRTVKSHFTPKQTGLDVECSLERGLICKSNGKGKGCPDFEIRVLCQCEETLTTKAPCDPARPNQEHPLDCHSFYHCDVTENGPRLVEKSCGPSMYYNPVSMICDWPYAVSEIKPECKVTTTQPPTEATTRYIPEENENVVEVNIPACPPNFVEDECAIKCDQLCLYYSHILKLKGKCENNVKCESGCVSAEKKLSCPPGMMWASNDTCVSLHDCLCRSNDGKPVKPGTIYRESDCKVCQCVDNFYTCDESACFTTTTTEKTELIFQWKNVTQVSSGEHHVYFTVTPPKKCDQENFIDIMQGDQPLPDDAFSASSVLSPKFQPQFAKLNNKVTDKSAGSWSPEYATPDQYLQINLGRQEPIYGVKVQGSPLYDEYVTSYKVSYSPDGKNFIPVLNSEMIPQIFRGSVDAHTPVQQVFDVPFEAEIVKINPQTWHNSISLRVELIGCGEPQSTTVPYEFITTRGTTEKQIYCEDSMGLGDGTMSYQQISVSSELDNSHTKRNLNITQENSWQPLTNSPTEFVQFDFLEPRNVTGLVTKGGPNGWVTTLSIKYSHDDKIWNPIMDKKTLQEKIFLANFDSDSPQLIDFDLPISARYVKIVPKKWKDNIQMRVEMHGCFEPYPEIEEILTTVAPSPCNECPGVKSEPMELQACRCEKDKWWDGENCVTRTECPCLVGHMAYPVGTVFEKEDCLECLCKLGGVTHCTPKQCAPCEKGLRSTVTSTCKCTCQPCPENTILCPTSNICINSTLWCNGIQDCPDDEISCITTTISTTVVTEKPEKKCPVLECPPGYRKDVKKISKAKKYHSYLSPMFSNYGRKAVKNPLKISYTAAKTGVKGGVKKSKLQRPVETTQASVVEEKICPEYRCVSEKPPPKFKDDIKECPPVSCPLNFVPLFDIELEEDTLSSKECPKYTCHQPPPPDAICNVTGRTFNTFDETEYKYDICNHVLARDLENEEWEVSLKKSTNCSETCTRDLIIRHQDHLFVLHPDLTVEFDGFKYTVDQTKKIGSQTQAFSISRLGNTLLFVSNRFGFWVIWNKQENVKLGAVRKLEGKIDGLCGFYNGNPEDDKRKPDGTPARTTVDFGDSWAQADQPISCETKACPMHIQNQAWEICNRVKNQVLAPCAQVVDIEAFISRCMETACDCLEAANKNHTAEEECRCNTLQSFVVDCLSANPNADLGDWRMQLDCPVICDAPLVFHDCYQRRCEPTCESVADPNVCPKLPHVCFPGCYCPPGFVKKGDNCIKPSSCRDCECNVLPHLQYVTYDDTNFTINGNCVYVMSRDALLGKSDKHKFQVLITNAPCKNNAQKTCVGKVTILYEGRKIHIFLDAIRNKLRLIVDGERIEDFSDITDWSKVRETGSKHLKILLTDIQVEISVYYPSLGVSVKAPSHKYRGKLEGLCGDCNKEKSNDLRTPGGVIVEDIDEFALSWLYDKLPGGQSKETCHNKPKEDCPPTPEAIDPCMQMLDFTKFGQCLRVLDAGLFFEWCKKDTCGNHPELACTAIEAYARDCANAGFCINWRNEICPAKTCPAGQMYEPCGTSCPKTCEGRKHKQKPCSKIPVEGCFCTEGKYLLNNTCVVEEDCEVCDEEGHHPGDQWKKDKCTSCTCEGTNLKCETEHCPGIDKICEKGYQAVKVPSKEDECCDKYACLPEPTAGPTCETPQSLNCGPGQIMKLDTKPNGCQQFICECKPIEDCDPIDTTTEEPLEDGYTKEIDESGCCPQVKLICEPRLCPKPKPCEQYYNLKNETITGKCCPLYTCEPPKDQCIVENEYTAAEKGGETPTTKLEKHKSLKNLDETWKDGPCRECVCIKTSIGNYQSSCTHSECAAIETSQDFLEYELEPDYVYNQCCPNITRIACKHNGKIYKVGEKWTKGNDYCTTYQCVNTTFGVQKETKITSCDTNCDLGLEYISASSESKQCCGSCKPYACVVDGLVHKIGDEWHSSDYCTKYSCLSVNGSLQVQSIVENCPELPKDFIEEFVFETIPIEGQCCKEHKVTACKVDGKVYNKGETWPSPDGDKCKTFTCVEKEKGELVKQESIETCKKDCAKGWEYQESKTSCCGECVQTACIVDNYMKKAGENWTATDNCTIYFCDNLGDQFVVTSQQESCPSIDDCPEENIYVKGCCKHCNITSAPQVMCSPEAIKTDKTVGIIKVARPPHGECINKKEIDSFTECVGSCHSSTFFNFKSGSHENDCSCCQATKYESIDVELECEDGHVWTKKVAVPAACGCEGCAAPKKYNAKTATKTFVKT